MQICLACGKSAFSGGKCGECGFNPKSYRKKLNPKSLSDPDPRPLRRWSDIKRKK